MSPEDRIDDLARRVAEVEARLDGLERSLGGRAARTSPPGHEGARGADSSPPRRTTGGVSAWVPLFGRTLLILAGAFFLRALTERGTFPQAVGTSLAIAYAIVWIALADREVGKGRRTSATLHAVASAAIAFPLLWEATIRFSFLSTEASAAALSAITILAMIVAHRRSLRRLAWVFTVGGVATALALAFATEAFALFGFYLLFLGLVTLWLGYLRGWQGPGWVAAVAVNGWVTLMTVALLLEGVEPTSHLFHPGSLMALQLSLVVTYLGSFGLRMLARGEELGGIEIVLAAFVLLVGLGGALGVVRTARLAGLGAGLVSLALAAVFYSFAFAVIDRRRGLKIGFIFCTTLALVFSLVALGTLVSGGFLSLSLAAAALFTAWWGARKHRATLTMHAAVYVVAAAIASNLVVGSARAFAATTVDARWVSGSVLVVLAVAATVCWLPVATHGRTWGRLARVPKFVILVILIEGLDGMLVSLLAPLVPASDSGALATLRTGVLAATVVGVGLLGRWTRLWEAGALVYPALIVGGLKLLVEDLRFGRPSTLFASLLVYGGALVLAPRLARFAGRGVRAAE